MKRWSVLSSPWEGCGYAGLHLASELKKAGVKFTLIEPKEYFHHCVAALRAAVDPTWVARTAIPLEEAFGSSYLQGRAVALDQEEKVVTLEDGQRISFSHCVTSCQSQHNNNTAVVLWLVATYYQYIHIYIIFTVTKSLLSNF